MFSCRDFVACSIKLYRLSEINIPFLDQNLHSQSHNICWFKKRKNDYKKIVLPLHHTSQNLHPIFLAFKAKLY